MTDNVNKTTNVVWSQNKSKAAQKYAILLTNFESK